MLSHFFCKYSTKNKRLILTENVRGVNHKCTCRHEENALSLKKCVWNFALIDNSIKKLKENNMFSIKSSHMIMYYVWVIQKNV